jgi:DNA (cytosine-5)-methyltransferase 1
MTAYYNEIDRYCAEWLRSLVSAGLIPKGDVDERPIEQVNPDDLKTYTQCHFFAGIAGWPLALRLARWADNMPVWTGSCPCQPFSAAGRQQGQADRRHLWPTWFRLISECRPPVLFGEQVAAAIAFGWLDEVFHDLEAIRYACAAAVLPACAVGAPHRRDRLYFVADADGDQYSKAKRSIAGPPAREARQRPYGKSLGAGVRAGGEADAANKRPPGRSGGPPDGALGNADEPGSQGRSIFSEYSGERSAWTAGLEWIVGYDGKWRPVKPGIRLLADGVPGRVGKLRAFGNAIVPPLAAEFISAYRECLDYRREGADPDPGTLL